MNTYFSTPNILIVDDIHTNLAVLAGIIQNAGYVARPVANARQAVSAIESFTPDLILMDISMPDIDGYALCSMLKKNANTREIPVIFISALESARDRIKGLKSGAVDFVAKPVEAEELILRINAHLKVHKIQQNLEAYNKKLNKIIDDQIQKLFEEQRNVVKTLLLLLSKNNPSISEHMDKLGKNSRMLAICLQMCSKYKEQITNSFIEIIEVVAPLCEIGKLMNGHSLIPSRYISYLGNDTAGVEILEEIYRMNENNVFLKMAIEIAKFQQEHWDGTGYPDGALGTDIPLCARIIAIVRAYTFLGNDVQVSHEQRIELINHGTGTIFDPDIVAIFNKINNQFVRQ